MVARQLDLNRGDVDAGYAVPARELARCRDAAPATELEDVGAVQQARVEIAHPIEDGRIDPARPFGIAQSDCVVTARYDLFRIARNGASCHLPHRRRVTATRIR